ncbi:beta-lactamase family protein [Zavarzinia compransoris]|uniref:serine hydrolase domain-containing protein n=1 Tax=Zavarzinia marina TaxID=2911065 RepID=UPI001F2536A1|nr:serine hydrolase [Zavarzinia marina]MCF4164608.1 beta-lactamase family protein [Zavarzinia marina]
MKAKTRRLLILPLVLAALLGAGLWGCADLRRAVAVPVHFTSHGLCSAVFIGGADARRYFEDAIAPQIAPADALIDYAVDREGRAVSADLAGLVESRAVYRGAAGCIVVHEGMGVPADTGPPPSSPADIAAVEPGDAKWQAALARAFAETPRAPHRRTKAVVVMVDGRVVAERYAPGVTPGTPLPGWSMTKSVANALIGILVRDGRLDVAAPAPVAAWLGAGDGRRRISVEHLMRMTGGLDLGDSVAPGWTAMFDRSAQMAFDMPDTAAFAGAAPLVAEPGTLWGYADGSTQILAGIIRDAVGGDVAGFIRRELLDPLGMTGVTIETDAAGTPLLYAQMWAPARAWARFGMLFADDGMAGGRRILPPGWVDLSARQTEGSEDFGYGAGFWTNRGEGPAIRHRLALGLPADSFMARGNQGQYVVVVPRLKLVIVRMGSAFTPRGDIETVARLVADVVAIVEGR